MNDIKNTSDLVKKILSMYPKSRNSDDYLYVKVCESINAIATNLPFYEIMLNRKNYSFPSFETVRRTRQKIQRTYPELSGNDDVEANRLLREYQFRYYEKNTEV